MTFITNKKMAALKAENKELNDLVESLKQDVKELKDQLQSQSDDQHADVQQSLIGEFEMSQEEFDTKLIEGLKSPQVSEFMGRMLQNAMMMGLGR